MPQVQSDPKLTTIITNGGQDLFSFPTVNQASILELQTDPRQALPAGTASDTQLLAPDLHIDDQLKNFPSNVYDLSPTSLLTHFMQAILGAPGMGQVRNRQMIARLQQAITSTHFYDLDSFYGALFGALRGPSGTLPTNPATGQSVNPYTELASPDGWDEIEAIDARFRERIIALAKAITLGATVPGLQAIAEAITGAPCQIYETFRLIPNPLDPPTVPNTWLELEAAYATWGDFPAVIPWRLVEGRLAYAGLMGNGATNEVVIRPRKTYTTSQADLIAQGSEQYGILSVAEVLKPAASLVSVDDSASGVVVEVPISAIWSHSEFCEITLLVTPSDTGDPDYTMAQNAYQLGGAPVTAPWQQPRPPHSRSEGTQFSYVSDVASVTGKGVLGSDPNSEEIINGQDFQTVIFGQAPLNMRIIEYKPPKAIERPGKAGTARTSSGVSVKAAPYSGPRVPISRAT